MQNGLGEITQVNVRAFWKHEQYDFTPWLASGDNIARLANAVGLELEVEGIEVAVGPYSADILAKDIGSNRYVVIENQFGKTNHDHLGKLITYASFLDAGAVIWIAEHFTEEHQKALAWLNDHTTEDLEFYAVAVELWQIDQSRPAVRFNVVSRPNELVKQAAVTKIAGELSEARQTQLEFWTAFRDQLLARGILKSAHTPRPQYWFDISIGKSGVFLSNIANTQEGRIGIRLYISHQVAGWVLPALEGMKAEIETQIGEPLLWNPNPHSRDKIVALYQDANLEDRNSWPAYLDWMLLRVVRFREAFAARVKSLRAPELDS